MCANGGICQQANSSMCFVCNCKSGFTGTMCQIKEDIQNASKDLYFGSFYVYTKIRLFI